MKKMESEFDIFSKSEELYLKKSSGKCREEFKQIRGGDKIVTNFLALYRVDEITFEDKAPRKEALENVISSMNIKGVNFVYLILGNEKGVSFYYGVVRDFSADVANLEISDIGEMILKPSLQGNFRGSKITEIKADEKKNLLQTLDSLKRAKILEGVPGINKDDERFQSVDRIIDVMLGDTFALMLIAKPLEIKEIMSVQEKVYDLYDFLSPMAKMSVQENFSKSESTSNTHTEGSSDTNGKNDSKSKTKGNGHTETYTSGTSSSRSKSTGSSTGTEKSQKTGSEENTTGDNHSKSEADSDNQSDTETYGTSTSNTQSKSESNGTQTNETKGSANTKENINKKIQDWLKYMDEIILPRIDYGFGRGLFLSSMILFGNERASLIKLENTIRSVYGGETGNKMPLKAFDLTSVESSYYKKMQIPYLTSASVMRTEEIGLRTVCSQLLMDKEKSWLGNWMSAKEMSLLAGLPQKEVVGLALREEVEFGLNTAEIVENPVLLGYLVQNGVVLNGNGVPKIEVHFEKSYFDKHIFVTGVTGSGKTTTCQKLLLESGENFLVIEPAKTEYRILAQSECTDMLVFTLGKETGAPFRLNPFEFFEGENITSRVDMIKASMEAAFDMEAAIPQILETAIYECYEDKGWDISTNKNRNYENPYADGIQAFPTLGDLDQKIAEVVESQGFTDRLRDEYIGSIRARLKGLLVGAKGIMLNTPRSVDFVELLERKVVLELEHIKSASEKSLIMGFILINLTEAIKVKYEERQEPLEHLTLIEEAHRLFSKFMPGDSLNKKQGIEMFTDMLAEVRKYGESLIISDQIPNKMTPEVLKNTNTKIVHKIFAQDDKEAIGNTMALKEEQKEHLSYLTCGRAIIMHPGLSKAVQIQVSQTKENDTNRTPQNDRELRKRILEYYASIYKRGVLPGLEGLQEKPSSELINVYLENLNRNSEFVLGYQKYIYRRSHGLSESFINDLRKYKEQYGIGMIAEILCCLCHEKQSVRDYPQIRQYIEEFLEFVLQNGTERMFSKFSVLQNSLIRPEK